MRAPCRGRSCTGAPSATTPAASTGCSRRAASAAAAPRARTCGTRCAPASDRREAIFLGGALTPSLRSAPGRRDAAARGGGPRPVPRGRGADPLRRLGLGADRRVQLHEAGRAARRRDAAALDRAAALQPGGPDVRAAGAGAAQRPHHGRAEAARPRQGRRRRQRPVGAPPAVATPGRPPGPAKPLMCPLVAARARRGARRCTTRWRTDSTT